MKLTTEQKLEIVLSGQSLREIGKKFNVHHSVVDELKKDVKVVLRNHLEEKSNRIGRPKKESENIKIAALEEKIKEMNKEMALQSMKIDWLALKLKWAEERTAEKDIKLNGHLKKKEKIDKIKLGKKHGAQYAEISGTERLKCLDTTPSEFKYLCENIRDRLKKESSIPEDDLEEAIKQIIDFPFLGGRKGALKLLDEAKALIGETFYKEIKQQLMNLTEEELAKKKLESELKKNQFKRQKKELSFEKIKTKHAHDVWAIDFTYLKLFGIQFYICVVYELHSQAYLSIIPCEAPTKEIAMLAVQFACMYAKTKPRRCLLSDNGSQFISFKYLELLDYLKITDLKIPPGKPWFNGALESGNRDLKHVILTIAFYMACNKPNISKTGVSREQVLTFLKECCDKAKKIINEKIPRTKFGTTPLSVLEDKIAKKRAERVSFKNQKKKERTERMAKIKAKGIKSKNKTVEDKVKSIWQSVSKLLSLEKLSAFADLLNKRYAVITN